MTSDSICFKTSHCGAPILEINGIKLHSSYDPEKEAARFIETAFSNETPGTIILLGAGMDYTLKAIRKQYPAARVLPVYYSTEVYRQCGAQHGWHPQAGLSLLDYMRENLNELDIKDLKFLTWPASARIYSAFARQVELELSHFVKELSGSFLTSYTAGKLWIKNSFYNFIHTDTLYTFTTPRIDKPVLIAGSGPSLAAAVPLIHAERDRISVWALPSAVLFLEAHAIVPDLIILTDPGYYSTYHLRSLKAQSPALALPLAAGTGTWQLPARSVYLAQDNFFEKALLATLPLSFVPVAPLGTVAATALELALAISQNFVLLCGLDFCGQDIQSHVLPNPFQQWLESASGRLTPAYSLTYHRARTLSPLLDKSTRTRTSQPLQTYAGWFNHLPEQKKQRIFRIHTNLPVQLQARSLTCTEAARLIRTQSYRHIPLLKQCKDYPTRKQRIKNASVLIHSWEDKLAAANHNLHNDHYDPRAFFSDKLLYDLAYFTDLDKLNKAYHHKGSGAPLRTLLTELTGTVSNFLELLQAKITAKVEIDE